MARRRANAELGDVEELGLQLTPMIDVIFQLLLFFLVTIKFPTNEGLLKAFLPKASTEPVPDEKTEDQADVYIQKDAGQVVLIVGPKRLGVMEVQNEGRSDERVVLAVGQATDSLENHLKMQQDTLEAQGKGPLKVVIKAEPGLPYKYVVYVMNVCGRLKIEDVMFRKPGRSDDAAS